MPKMYSKIKVRCKLSIRRERRAYMDSRRQKQIKEHCEFEEFRITLSKTNHPCRFFTIISICDSVR